MALMRLAEIFGFPVTDLGEAARTARAQRHCPFRGSTCTKGSKTEPLGTCSLTDGQSLATICPVRFLEGFRLFKDAARLAFGTGAAFVAAPEVRILKIGGGKKANKIGKIDFILTRVADDGTLTDDFAALEVQAVYFSGGKLRPSVAKFLETGDLDAGASRRPDWRSSIQKRLMPQLALKVPRIRNLHRKFFVATDAELFRSIPQMNTVASFENSEVTWLAYPFENAGTAFVMGDPRIVYTEWEAVLTALREGEPLSREEILTEVARKRKKFRLPTFEA